MDRDTHAITDLVDEHREAFLLRYPVTLIAALIVFGLVAFISLGYFGYSDDPPVLRTVLHDPWPLFLWLCLLDLLLVISILRHPLLRPYLIVLLGATLLSMALVGGAWYSGVVRRDVLDTSLARALLSSPFLLLLAIAGILLVLFLLSLWRPRVRVVLVLLVTLLSTVGLLIGAHVSAIYMHTAAGQAPAGDPRLAFGHALAIFLVAAAGIAGGFVAAAAALALTVFRVAVLENAVRFLLFLLVVAYTLFPTFAVINTVVWLTGISFRTPFFQPSVSGLLAVIIFLISGSRWVLSALRELTGTRS